MSDARIHLQQAAEARQRAALTASPREFHRTMPGYQPSALVSLPELAEELGLAEVLVKDECERFELPSFKILGGSWAVNRLVCHLVGVSPAGRSYDDLREAAAQLGEAMFVTATDGNHGRGVARMAKLLGLSSHVMVPDDMVEARRDAIASEGATVEVIDGDYDDAVRAAADLAAASERNHLVADVALREDDEVPRWVMEGYDTIFDEVAEQTDAAPTVLFVQAGVGALAAAALDYYEAREPALRTAIVEPLSAACVLESAIAGRPVSLDDSQGSMMAGLNCGTPSTVAWPSIQARTTAFMALGDDTAGHAMRLLADAGVVAGESGAAGLAGLIVAARDPETREALGLGADSRVLTINTEWATDPDNYRRIVGDKADELLAATG